MHKFDVKFQNGLFLKYTFNDSYYRVYNLETNVVDESTNVIFYKAKPNKDLFIDYDEKDDIVSIKTQTKEETNVKESHKTTSLNSIRIIQKNQSIVYH